MRVFLSVAVNKHDMAHQAAKAGTRHNPAWLEQTGGIMHPPRTHHSSPSSAGPSGVVSKSGPANTAHNCHLKWQAGTDRQRPACTYACHAHAFFACTHPNCHTSSTPVAHSASIHNAARRCFCHAKYWARFRRLSQPTIDPSVATDARQSNSTLLAQVCTNS